MTRREAVRLADQQIGWWQASRWLPIHAMDALTGYPVWAAEWWEVRAFMVDWLLTNYGRSDETRGYDMTRWITPDGARATELSDLIRLAQRGESWADIGRTFYPHRGNAERRACDVFTAYATDEEREERRAALKSRKHNRRSRVERGAYMIGGGVVEPAPIREQCDPWAGMGACFAGRPVMAAE